MGTKIEWPEPQVIDVWRVDSSSRGLEALGERMVASTMDTFGEDVCIDPVRLPNWFEPLGAAVGPVYVSRRAMIVDIRQWEAMARLFEVVNMADTEIAGGYAASGI